VDRSYIRGMRRNAYVSITPDISIVFTYKQTHRIHCDPFDKAPKQFCITHLGYAARLCAVPNRGLIMDEVEAIQAVANALEHLGEEERSRVLTWAHSKYGGSTSVAAATKVEPAVHNEPAAPTNNGAIKPRSKKTKIIISMDKSLNLAPSGKQSAVEFAALKLPPNVKEKCIVAVYYLRDVIEMPKVSAQAVFTFFKFVQWPVPADLKNTLQQAGTAGWLDTADSDDIKLTALGENRVEHDLPMKTKAKT
jgi:hypothetical protein